MKESTQRRVMDVLVVKAAVLWVGSLTAIVGWGLDHPQLGDVLVVLAGLTTGAALWMRTDRSRDAWRRGYKTALEDTQPGRGEVRRLPMRR